MLAEKTKWQCSFWSQGNDFKIFHGHPAFSFKYKQLGQKVFFCWQSRDVSLFEPIMCFDASLWLVDMMLMKPDFKSHVGQLALQRKIFHTLSALVTPPGRPKNATGHKRFWTSPSSPLYMERSPKDHWGWNKGRPFGSAEKGPLFIY